ncbi:MAG TPA: heterodisulfide reductase-related iron-sulfur binding cluster [Vicinamibacterales bacterium]|nr:heterodisulfide reductase-related iron-sulfur binding cluster [Vicinamibacterales bacterium]
MSDRAAEGPRAAVAFDANHPPQRALIDTCVHCGFCLPTCPTYALWSEEMDSPRGRIYLMSAALDGRTAMTPAFVRHFDACLGCMACVTACPSGVQYAPLIEATRGQIERRHGRSFADRLFRELIFALFPYPGRMRLALAPLALRSVKSVALRSQPGERPSTADGRGATASPERPDRGASPSSFLSRVRAMMELAPPVSWQSLRARTPEHTSAVGERRLTVGFLTGCVQRVAFPHVNEATVRVLSAEGCDVVAPREQGCCGALALHAGRLDEAREFARTTIGIFDRAGVERIAVNAAGCGSSMKEYGQLLAGDPAWADRARAFSARVRDVSEVVAELGEPRAPRQRLALKVAYHDACHLAHAQGVRQQPRDLLKSIPGIALVPLAEPDMCCGSAGIYNLVEPEPARELGERKAMHIEAAQPDVVVTANPGCTLQIAAAARRRGTQLTIRHPIELLDASIRGR